MAAEDLLHQVEVPTSQCRQDVSVVLDASNADRAASPLRNTIVATVSLSAKTAAPCPFSLTQARGGRREHRCSIRIATNQ
jgi:hypothetical protein